MIVTTSVFTELKKNIEGGVIKRNKKYRGYAYISGMENFLKELGYNDTHNIITQHMEIEGYDDSVIIVYNTVGELVSIAYIEVRE